MTKEVFFIKSENKLTVENMLRKNELINRGSITIKDAKTLDSEKEGFYFILDLSVEASKKADELLKEISEKVDNKENIIKKVEEQENSATQGFGNIIGD